MICLMQGPRVSLFQVSKVFDSNNSLNVDHYFDHFFGELPPAVLLNIL